MKILKKIINYVFIKFRNGYEKTANIISKIISRIKSVRMYYKVATIYLLVLAIMVGIFIWRARSYYPEIPLGKEQSLEDEDYLEANKDKEGSDSIYNDGKQVENELRIEENEGRLATGHEEFIMELLWPIEGRDNHDNVKIEFGEYVRHVTKNEQNAHYYSHAGIDICVPEGTKVLAVDNGEVIKVKDPDLAFGKSILLKHSDEVYSFYGSLSEISVEQGKEVTKGQEIGEVGMTAIFDSGLEQPYLHFELRINEKSVDPLKFLP